MRKLMPDKPHITERAYQIATAGDARSIEDLIQKLKAEGYDDYRSYIAGSLRKELGKLIKGSGSPEGDRSKPVSGQSPA